MADPTTDAEHGNASHGINPGSVGGKGKLGEPHPEDEECRPQNDDNPSVRPRRVRLLLAWVWDGIKSPDFTNPAIALATIVIAVATVLTYCEVHQGSAQTDRIIAADERIAGGIENTVGQANKSLNASIEIARTDQRAWVGVISINGADYTETVGKTTRRIFIEEGEIVKLGANIQNSGKSIAKNVTNCVTFDIAAADQPFIPRVCEPTEQPSTAVLQPNVTVTIWTEGRPIGTKISKDAVDALKSGRTRCYLYGWNTYEDIFNRPHRFKFLMVLSPDLTAFGSYGGKEYNDAD